MPTINFKGKTFVQNHHLAVKYHQLIPDKEKSLTDKVSLHDNLVIHGDNLAALKSLLPEYEGRIKCIYIDPPYNTGNDARSRLSVKTKFSSGEYGFLRRHLFAT